MQVDVSEEEDQFQAVTTACLTVLILAVETRLDTALQQMTRMPWATLETVSCCVHCVLSPTCALACSRYFTVTGERAQFVHWYHTILAYCHHVISACLYHTCCQNNNAGADRCAYLCDDLQSV